MNIKLYIFYKYYFVVSNSQCQWHMRFIFVELCPVFRQQTQSRVIYMMRYLVLLLRKAFRQFLETIVFTNGGQLIEWGQLHVVLYI